MHTHDNNGEQAAIKTTRSVDLIFIVHHVNDDAEDPQAADTRDHVSIRDCAKDNDLEDLATEVHRYQVLRYLIAVKPTATGMEHLEEFLGRYCEVEEELKQSFLWGIAALRILGYDISEELT